MSAFGKFLTEAGPLLVFFAANAWFGIFVATGAFMVAVIAALIVSYVRTRTWPMVALVSAVIVLIFGGLTLYLQNETFIKVKPTILYALFAATLLGGLARGRSLLKPVFEVSFPPLSDEGWRRLTFRWGLFFLCLAGLNELAWRLLTTDQWVSFKVFGVLPLTLVFALTQMPLVLRHTIDEGAGDED